jgi:hypothetical protein
LTDALSGIIAQLQRQRSAIDRALEALREVEGIEAPNAAPVKRTAVKAPGKSASDRRSEGQRKRWAAKKAEGAVTQKDSDEPPAKSRITPEGRQKLAEAMKKRWAVKRAGSTAKKMARKKRAATKAG